MRLEAISMDYSFRMEPQAILMNGSDADTIEFILSQLNQAQLAANMRRRRYENVMTGQCRNFTLVLS
jgi:Cu/Ag efflux protein CusF